MQGLALQSSSLTQSELGERLRNCQPDTLLGKRSEIQGKAAPARSAVGGTGARLIVLARRAGAKEGVVRERANVAQASNRDRCYTVRRFGRFERRPR